MKYPTRFTPNKRPTNPGGFTLTELLVVILIILVLGALSFLTVGTFRKKAWAAESSSNLRQLGTAIQSYVDENNPNNGNRYIRPVNLSNPVRLILLGDAPLKTPGKPASGCHSAWWSLRFGAVQGNPEERVNENLLKNDIDFWNNGKALFLFADCHVETLGPKEIRKRNFQL